MSTAAGRKRTAAARKAAAARRKKGKSAKPAAQSGSVPDSDRESSRSRKDRLDRNARVMIGGVAVLSCIVMACGMAMLSWGGTADEQPDEPNNDQEPGPDQEPDEEPADDDDQGGGDEPDQGEGDDDQDGEGDEDGGDGDQDGEGEGEGEGEGDGEGDGDGQQDGEGEGEEDEDEPPDCWPGAVVPPEVRDQVLLEVVELMPDKHAAWMDQAGYAYESSAEYYMVAGIRRAMMHLGVWKPEMGDTWPGVGTCVSENGKPCCYVQQPSQLDLADSIALAFAS